MTARACVELLCLIEQGLIEGGLCGEFTDSPGGAHDRRV